MLDQLELCDALLELGVVSKTGMNFREYVNSSLSKLLWIVRFDSTCNQWQAGSWWSSLWISHGQARRYHVQIWASLLSALTSLTRCLTYQGDSLHLRQRLIEQAFEAALLERNVCVHFQHQLESYTMHEDESDAYPVHCVIRDLKADTTHEVHGYASSPQTSQVIE